MSEYLLKTSKCSLFPLRVILVFFVTLVALYICYLSMNQINVEKQARDILITSRIAENDCPMDDIPLKDIQYVHFPQPKTYNRGECSCSPVRYFVIVSMQRSGSGWFETLLNSHPNVSSNGEIFSMLERRADASSIIKTLDTVYNLDWLSSAAKNECATAFGLKWMLNQGLMDHQKKILSYFKAKGVSVIFLFRRNLLRRLISVLANDYDRQEKQFNGTHKSHVHSREEAEILARFRPTINTATLISDLSNAEKAIADCLQYYSSIRHLILYYEDIVNNQNALSHVQEFLGLPIRKLVSRQVKIHTRPLSEQVINWKDVLKTLNETQYKYKFPVGKLQRNQISRQTRSVWNVTGDRMERYSHWLSLVNMVPSGFWRYVARQVCNLKYGILGQQIVSAVAMEKLHGLNEDYSFVCGWQTFGRTYRSISLELHQPTIKCTYIYPFQVHRTT